MRARKSSSPANEHTKEVHRQYLSSQKECIVKYAKLQHCAKECSILVEKGEQQDLVIRVSEAKEKKSEHWRGHKAGRKLTYLKEVDEKLFEWLLSMREQHLCVSEQMLCDKAEAAIVQHNHSYQTSKGRVRKFMICHSIVLQAKPSVAQKLPADFESKIEAFYKDVQDRRVGGNYSREMIGNMDETPLYF